VKHLKSGALCNALCNASKNPNPASSWCVSLSVVGSWATGVQHSPADAAVVATLMAVGGGRSWLARRPQVIV
jgi:hypothetical protein